jgi:hypothetical protein
MHDREHPKRAVELLGLSRAALDRLFRAGAAQPTPAGRVDGTLLLAAGLPLGRVGAAIVRRAVWQGKIFDPLSQTIRNVVSPLGIEAVVAHTSIAPSRLDGRPCILLDYGRTSLIARGVRDELRRIGPGLYLGLAYWHGHRVLAFALEARDPSVAQPAAGGPR